MNVKRFEYLDLISLGGDRVTEDWDKRRASPEVEGGEAGCCGSFLSEKIDEDSLAAEDIKIDQDGHHLLLPESMKNRFGRLEFGDDRSSQPGPELEEFFLQSVIIQGAGDNVQFAHPG